MQYVNQINAKKASHNEPELCVNAKSEKSPICAEKPIKNDHYRRFTFRSKSINQTSQHCRDPIKVHKRSQANKRRAKVVLKATIET